MYVPLALLSGWVHAVATVNPATLLLENGRDLIAGTPGEVALAIAIAIGLIAVMATWAVRSLRRAEAAGA